MNYLSDSLPPTFIRDWRRLYHSKAYVILTIVLMAWPWLTLLQTNWQEVRNLSTAVPYDEYFNGMSDMELYMHSLNMRIFWSVYLLMLFVFPLRMAGVVHADTHVKGTNFLQVTPLSSWKIVSGTWLAAFSQCCVLGLLYIPLILVRGWLMPMGTGQDWELFATAVVLGGLFSAFFMFAGGLASILRFGMLAVSFFVVLFLHEACLASPLLSGSVQEIAGCLAIMAIAICMLLLLSCRHYAAPAENCALPVRALSLACAAVVFTALCLYIEGVGPFANAGSWLQSLVRGLLIICVFGSAMDAALPFRSMPTHASRTAKFLPTWLQVPGVAQSALVMLPCIYVFSLNMCADYFVKYLPEDQAVGAYGPYVVALGVALGIWLMVVLSLLLADILCRRANPLRPLFVALSCFAIIMSLSVTVNIIAGVVGNHVVMDLLHYLPLFNIGTFMNPSKASGMAGPMVAVILESIIAYAALFLRSRKADAL